LLQTRRQRKTRNNNNKRKKTTTDPAQEEEDLEYLLRIPQLRIDLLQTTAAAKLLVARSTIRLLHLTTNASTIHLPGPARITLAVPHFVRSQQGRHHHPCGAFL
jgi:hypothetical protein